MDFMSYLNIHVNSKIFCDPCDKNHLDMLTSLDVHDLSKMVHEEDELILRLMEKPMIWLQINSNKCLYVQCRTPPMPHFELVVRGGRWVMGRRGGMRLWRRVYEVPRRRRVVKFEIESVDEDGERCVGFEEFVLMEDKL